jgi:hypothetical protein
MNRKAVALAPCDVDTTLSVTPGVGSTCCLLQHKFHQWYSDLKSWHLPLSLLVRLKNLTIKFHLTTNDGVVYLSIRNLHLRNRQNVLR